jgi:glycerate dehydrogenase
LLDEEAVADALAVGKLYAVGVDVLEEEPPRKGSPLISAPRCFITPHIAWASAAARRRLIDIATQNVAAFMQGKSLNRI